MSKYRPLYAAVAALIIAGIIIFWVSGTALFSFLLLAGCMLMMVIMMRAMGGMGGDDHHGHNFPHSRR